MAKRIDLTEIYNRYRAISLIDKLLFTRNLGVMITAGLPLSKSLDILTKQTESLKFQKIIEEVSNNVRGGKNFAESLAKYPNLFSELFINMIKVGETTGNLEEILKILGRQLKKEYSLRSRIKSALMYPAIIILAMLAIGSLMMITVVPKLAETFKELDVELPWSTQIIIFFSETLASYWYLYLFGLGGFGYLIYFIIWKTQRGRNFLDYFFLHLPYFNTIVIKFNIASFARTFGSLINGGVSLMSSLEITSHTLGNHYYAESLIKIAKEVEKGKPLNEPLAQWPNLYPTLVTQMIAVGEETGALSEILRRLALFYEEEISTITKGLNTIIEPILMILIGIVVGFFAISMIQPIYSIVGGIK